MLKCLLRAQVGAAGAAAAHFLPLDRRVELTIEPEKKP